MLQHVNFTRFQSTEFNLLQAEGEIDTMKCIVGIYQGKIFVLFDLLTLHYVLYPKLYIWILFRTSHSIIVWNVEAVS